MQTLTTTKYRERSGSSAVLPATCVAVFASGHQNDHECATMAVLSKDLIQMYVDMGCTAVALTRNSSYTLWWCWKVWIFIRHIYLFFWSENKNIAYGVEKVDITFCSCFLATMRVCPNHESVVDVHFESQRATILTAFKPRTFGHFPSTQVQPLSKFSQSKTRSQHDNLSQKNQVTTRQPLSKFSHSEPTSTQNFSTFSRMRPPFFFSALHNSLKICKVQGWNFAWIAKYCIIYCTAVEPCSKFKTSGGHVLGKHDACGRASFGRSLARRSGRHSGICEHVLAHELAPVVAGQLLVGFPHQVLPAWKHAAAPSGWSGSALPAPARWGTTAETAAQGSGSSAGSSPWPQVQVTVHNYTKGFEIDMRKMLRHQWHSIHVLELFEHVWKSLSIIDFQDHNSLFWYCVLLFQHLDV